MTQLQRILYKQLCKKSLYEFVKLFWNECEPAKLIDGKLVQFYCETFQYMCRKWVGYTEINVNVPKITDTTNVIDIRSEKNKININVPPRHTKSMIFNVFGPVWLWLSHPIKAASVSHTGGLATSMNEKRKAIINSPLFQELFSDIYLESNTAGFLKDARGGELYSMNRNAFTGYGADIIVNDDLTNAETARKDKEEMGNAWAYYQNTMPSRVNDISKCVIINIQQRLAPNDITGHIMNEPKLAEQYNFIVLPARFTKDTYVVCPISGDILFWKKGEGLWPERFGDYTALEYQVGETVWETQYMQNPIASDKTIIKEDMIIELAKNEVPEIENAEMIYSSHDFPVKDKETSDFLGSVLAYKVGSNLYISDCLEKKMAFKAGVRYVTQLDTYYPGIIQVIEDKANGAPIIQQLQDEVSGIIPFEPGSASKTQRLESASLYMGNVIFVKNKFNTLTQQYELSDSLRNLRTRLLQFPFVEHDDIVDAFSMLLLFVFMDKRNCVYGRSFNNNNIINNLSSHNIDYTTIFFNKEGDYWKATQIGVEYGVESRLIVEKEIFFKSSIEEAITNLKKFAPHKNVFIDCSSTEAMKGMYQQNVSIERYVMDDFDMSVTQLNLAFSKNKILIHNDCKRTIADIENFKFSKSKDENVKYATTKDGFVACLRIALKYYGGII